MSITDSDVEVYDNAFTFDDCVKMLKLFSLFTSKGVKNLHGYFKRPDKNSNKPLSEIYNNPFEYMIDDYLTKIGDKSPMVEYWYRPRWVDIACHQDLNEYCLTAFDNVINPYNGHIMYLSDHINQAATVMFNVDMTAVTLIYPKIGRIVRFNGKSYHAVPNPLSKIFNSDEGPLQDACRHVLLFNTWNDYIAGPDESLMKCKILATPKFIPKSEWIKVPLFDTIPLKTYDFTIKMDYMGNLSRRFGENTTGHFYVDKRIAEDGYHQHMIAYEVLNVNKDKENHKEI